MYLQNDEKELEIQRTILTCDPGTVNTKMLLAGWEPVSIQVYEANDQFRLVTEATNSLCHRTSGGYFTVNQCMYARKRQRVRRRRGWFGRHAKERRGCRSRFDI